MQTLSHSGFSRRASSNITSFVLVGAAHAVLIYGLLVVLDIVPAPGPMPHTHVRVLDNPKPAPTPTPPEPTWAKPTTPTPRAPLIPIDRGSPGNSITIPDGSGLSPPVPPVVTAASGLSATHTIPGYPPLDRRLGHEGTVRLTLSIDALGAVSGAAVERSSGYDGLDAAAVAWVKAHWRYKPAT
ncbi:MAG: energy transducer TonB, partial [Rhizomicrobium sp.]